MLCTFGAMYVDKNTVNEDQTRFDVKLSLFVRAHFISILSILYLYFMYIYIISKGLQCALTAITIVALWQFLHLGRGMCAILPISVLLITSYMYLLLAH